jgi:hypothetical protein
MIIKGNRIIIYLLTHALNFLQHNKGGCVITLYLALPFTLKSILRQKKNYENSNISPMQKYNLQKLLQKKPKSFKILL